LHDFDAAIFKWLHKTPFSSLWILDEDLHIPRIMVWNQMTKSFGF
jgi:hypothetical protein